MKVAIMRIDLVEKDPCILVGYGVYSGRELPLVWGVGGSVVWGCMFSRMVLLWVYQTCLFV